MNGSGKLIMPLPQAPTKRYIKYFSKNSLRWETTTIMVTLKMHQMSIMYTILVILHE